MSVSYRLATADDAPILAAMRYAYWQETGHDPAECDRAAFLEECAAYIRQGLADGAWACWLAETGGEIVAHVYIQRIAKLPKPSKLHDAYGYVTNVYTRPANRNQGIGAALMQHVQDWARAQDLEFLMAWPSEESQRFYARAGYAPTEAVEFSLRPYVD